jgi:hypothetical protein
MSWRWKYFAALVLCGHIATVTLQIFDAFREGRLASSKAAASSISAALTDIKLMLAVAKYQDLLHVCSPPHDHA